MQSLPPQHMSGGIIRNATFTNRPPSPPYIHIPTPLAAENSKTPSVTPSYDTVDPSLLTPEDLQIITGGRAQQAVDLQKTVWRYEDRRRAQPVLDFLYLGPLAVVRDHEFLREEGITLLLAVRDAAMAHMRIQTVDRAVAELGLEVQYLDIADRQQLIQALPHTINNINDHLLRVYRSQLQTVGGGGGGGTAIDPSAFRRGKVLVFCETGNERGAVVAAAYLMSMYGTEMVSAVQFVSCQRFCVTFDEPTKHMLQSFGDILDAKKMIARQNQQQAMPSAAAAAAAATATATATATRTSSKKRGFEETMGQEDQDEFAMDMDRYEDRPAFQPYAQGYTDTTMG
ncbi:Serine/threonine/tyrosine-interacting protein [Cytospora mali]|uniref:Serine/threonine/tyrosine-interacting protein n=1 Tax=Cytospora mali TaxID=578113 RepID=A0A194VI41_CYTMA|nr:Serine/threonine/tyrosine-interacting protein [Valsa mali]